MTHVTPLTDSCQINFTGLSEAVSLINLSETSWPILFANEAWVSHVSTQTESKVGFWDLFKVRLVRIEGLREQRKIFPVIFPYLQLPGDERQAANTRQSFMQAISEQFTFNLDAQNMKSEKIISLQFRSAKSATIGSFMPIVGIPSTVSPSSADGPCYYYATITGQRPPDPHSDEKISDVPMASFSVVNDKIDPFDDVRLGPMLGRGAFGRVYRGTWNTSPVAIKVMEHTANADGELMEALLSSKVSHPHVVRAVK